LKQYTSPNGQSEDALFKSTSVSLTGYLSSGRHIELSSNAPADRAKSPEENFLQTFDVDGDVDSETAKMITRLSGNAGFPDTKDEK
jgi:hypothetical protein